jgi:inositol transport system permease protein
MMKEIKDIMKKISWSKYYIYFIAVGMIIFCTALNKNFLTGRNIINILTQMSIITIAAFAETLLFITGVMDLSIGSTMALTGISSVVVYLNTGSMSLAIITAALLGIICNAISGIVIVKLNMHPFIVTLGTMQIWRGIVLLYTGGVVISKVGDYNKLGQGRLFGVIPYPIIAMFIIMVILWVILKYTKYGRNAFATGGNSEAARASAINTKRTVLTSFIIAGIFTGIAGVMLMSRMASGLPTAGEGYEMDAMTAAVIGGTSFTGGIGTAFGTLIGGLIVGIINNILTLMGVQSYVQQILKGLIIVVAVAIDVNSQRKKMQGA